MQLVGSEFWSLAELFSFGWVAQREALHFSGGRFRKLVKKRNPPRIFVRRQLALDELLQFLSKLCVGRDATFGYNERFRLDQIIFVSRANNSNFQHRWMGDQSRLDFGGRNPHAADFEHVVAAPAMHERAVGVLKKAVAGAQPLAEKCFARLLRIIPVIRCPRRSFYLQLADFAARNFDAGIVDDARFVSGNGKTGGAVAHRAGTVGNKNVQHFRGADAVDDFDAGAIFPGAGNFFGKGFAGGNAKTKRVFAGARQIVGGEQGTEQRGDAAKNGGAFFAEDFADRFRSGTAGVKDAGGAHGKRKRKRIAKAVGEEEFSSRVNDIVLVKAENVLPK